MDRRRFLSLIVIGGAGLTVSPRIFAESFAGINENSLGHPLVQYNFKEVESIGESLDLVLDSSGLVTVLNSEGYYVVDWDLAGMKKGYRSLIYDPSTGMIVKPDVFSFSKEDRIAVGKINIPKIYSLPDLTMIHGDPVTGEDITFVMYSDIDAMRKVTSDICAKCKIFPGYEGEFCFGSPELSRDLGTFRQLGTLPAEWKKHVNFLPEIERFNSGSPVYDSKGSLLGIYISNTGKDTLDFPHGRIVDASTIKEMVERYVEK